MGKLYQENWYQEWQKEAILGKFPKWYRYRNKAVPVPPIRGQSVPVPIQAVPVLPSRMQSIPIPQCPKCPDCVVFAYLSLNSHTDCIGTLLND